MLFAVVYGTWSALQPGPVWIGPLPLTSYLLLWFVILPVALLFGAIEYGVRRIGPRITGSRPG